MRRAFLIGTCLVCNTLVPGQGDVIPKSKVRAAAKSGGFVLDAGEHELRDVFERAAKFLGRNYLFDSMNTAPRGRRQRGAQPVMSNPIQLQKKLILDAVACEEVISQLAFTRGYAVVPLDALRGIYEVISMRGSRANTIVARSVHMTPNEVLRRSRLRMYVATVVPTKHLHASRVAQQLRPFFAQGGFGMLQCAAAADSAVMLKGFSDQVACAIQLLKKIDTPVGNLSEGNASGQLDFLVKQHQQQQNRLKRLEQELRRLSVLVGRQQMKKMSPRRKVVEKK